MSDWMFDAFFWLVLPVAGLEALRIARSERKRERRSLSGALLFGGFEFLALGLLAATASPLLFMTVAVLEATSMTLAGLGAARRGMGGA